LYQDTNRHRLADISDVEITLFTPTGREPASESLGNALQLEEILEKRFQINYITCWRTFSKICSVLLIEKFPHSVNTKEKCPVAAYCEIA